MEKRLVNLTPHAIHFIDEQGAVKMTVEPSGVIARCATTTITTGEIAGIPVTTTEYGEVVNLPAPEKGTIYIVSSLVAQHCKDRGDVFVPGEQVRDDQGRVIGCRSLGLAS